MSKFYNAIMGFVVGDALGVPFEFCQRDTFKATDLTGYGTYNQPVGTWSDDSSMILATIESLALTGYIDLKDIMRNFYKWYLFGEFTPYGKVFDVGNTTKAAICRYAYNGIKPEKCGGDDLSDNGNGSLMRILPLAFIDHTCKDIDNVSALTHAHRISKIACNIYDDVARNLIFGMPKEDAIEQAAMMIPGSGTEFKRIRRIATIPVNEIKSTGYVVDTLEAALWCLTHTHSYKECVLAAVNLGNDTDTIAAICGGLAGIIYGVGGDCGIPEEWIEQIAKAEWIKGLCDSFEKVFRL